VIGVVYTTPMIYYKTQDEIEQIRRSCLLVSQTHAHIASMLRPGMTGLDIDKEAETFIRDHGAQPAFKGYNGFPNTLCVSINETVVHGIPHAHPFREGDIISVDCGVLLDGFFGDSAFTYAIGELQADSLRLLQVTRECLELGIQQARAGNRIGDISYAIQQHAEGLHKMGVVRELVGHGIGRALHEEPEVPNFGRRGTGPLIKSGLVIAIEPMINLGSRKVKQLSDGWTINTFDKKPSAHFEHTLAVTDVGPLVLSDHEMIEKAVAENEVLVTMSQKS
jgi:methionyl aminopeptidase